MFFYLYDPFVLDKKYEGLLDKVESRVIELGINGRVERLSPLRNIKELIEHGVKQGAHTVVVVGSDTTLFRTIQIAAAYPVSVGFIPVGTSELGRVFGVTDPLEACDTLSRRITKQLSLGKANQSYFLTELTMVVPAGTKFKCNDQWTITTQAASTEVAVVALGSIVGRGQNPSKLRDAITLQFHLQPVGEPGGLFRKAKVLHPTQVTLQKLVIDHPDSTVPALLDGATTLKTPLTISVKPKAVKVIVGKGRMI